MIPTDRVQKLEALLERVRKNRSAAPRHVPIATAAPLALDAFPPPAPAAVAPPLPVAPPSAPAATPPMPPAVFTPPFAVAPPPVAAPPPVWNAPHAEAPAVEGPPASTASFWPEPGSAVQSRPATMPPQSLPPEEVSDDDLLEVTTIPPESYAAGTEAVIDRPVLEPDATEVSSVTAVSDEAAPISSSRFKVPVTLDEALAGATQLEGEHEVPVQTPPPESGPQEAMPAIGIEAARLPDIEQLEADLSSPPSMGPTTEQLGETIDLEAPRGPDLEIEIDVTEEDAVPLSELAAAEELEVSLPRPSMQSGLYDLSAPAPGAYAEPVLAEPQASVQESRESAAIPLDAPAVASPERTARPLLGATEVASLSLGAAAAQKTFVDLLDASLGL